MEQHSDYRGPVLSARPVATARAGHNPIQSRAPVCDCCVGLVEHGSQGPNHTMAEKQRGGWARGVPHGYVYGVGYAWGGAGWGYPSSWGHRPRNSTVSQPDHYPQQSTHWQQRM